jgi:hypothetical protein
MIMAGIIHANWAQALIWTIAAAASLTGTFVGAQNPQSRRSPLARPVTNPFFDLAATL